MTKETTSGQSVCVFSFALCLSHCLQISPSHRVKVSPRLANRCGRLQKRENEPKKNTGDRQKETVMFRGGSERNRKGEKRMGDAFETPWGDEFTSCLFSATSATAKLTGPERSGEILPITVWLTESLQQPIVKKKKNLNALRSTWSGANNDQNPSAITVY